MKNTSVVFFSKFHLHHYISLRPAANPKVSHDQQRTSGDCCRGKGPLPVQLKCASLTSFVSAVSNLYFVFLNCIFKSTLGGVYASAVLNATLAFQGTGAAPRTRKRRYARKPPLKGCGCGAGDAPIHQFLYNYFGPLLDEMIGGASRGTLLLTETQKG